MIPLDRPSATSPSRIATSLGLNMGGGRVTSKEQQENAYWKKYKKKCYP